MSKTNFCPPMHTPEWKALVDHLGGDVDAAFKVWAQNNYEIPADITSIVAENTPLESINEEYSEDSTLFDRNRLLEKSKGVLTKKLLKLSKFAKTSPNDAEKVKDMQDLLSDMDKLEADFALNKFILAADRMSNRAESEMVKMKSGKKEVTLKSLKSINEYIDSLSLLKDVREDFFTDPEHKENFKIVDRIYGKQAGIKADFLFLARKAIAKQWAPHFDKIKADERVKAERKFNTTLKRDYMRKGIKGKELSDLQHDYIENHMMANAKIIKDKTEKYVQNMLVQTVDISGATTYLGNAKDMGHDIISLVTNSLDGVDYDISQTAMHLNAKADKINSKFIEYIGKKSDPKEQYSSLLYKDEEGNITPVMINPSLPGWIEFKQKYENTPVWELHTFLANLIAEKDSLVPGGLQLEYEIPRINKTSMERIAAVGVFNALKSGISETFKLTNEDTDLGNIDKRLKQGETANSIEVLSNEAGKERETVPLHYRAPLDIKSRTYDIVSAMLLDHSNSLNYKAKTESSLFLDVLKDVVSNADIVQRTSFREKFKIDKITGQKVVQKQDGSNLEKVLNHVISTRVYGVTTSGDPQVAKITKALGKYTSVLTMSGNILAALPNYIHGSTITWIEAIGDKKGLFNPKNRIKAAGKFDKDLHNIVADIGKGVPTSKTNLLAEIFGMHGNYRAGMNRFVDNNRGKKLASSSSLQFLGSAADISTQSILMYAILDNNKVLNAEGDYLNKDFKATKNREEAISMDDAMLINKHGHLEMHPSVFKTERTDGISNEDFKKISILMRSASREFFGNHDPNNKTIVQTTAVGGLMFQMRNWLIPGVQKRFGGIGNIGKHDYRDLTLEELNRFTGSEFDKDTLKVANNLMVEGITKQDAFNALEALDPRLANDRVINHYTNTINLEQKHYSVEKGTFREGQYITAMNFLYDLRYDLKALRLNTVPENWHNLTDQEKGNIRKTVIELGIAIMFLIASMKFDDLDDDDPDLVIATYLTRRMYSELFTFVNPKEAVRTFKSPFVAMGTVEDAMDLVIQICTDPSERYKAGRRRGEFKLNRRLTKLIPLYKQYDRNTKEALIFLQR